MVTRYEPRSAEVYRQLMALVRDRHGAMVFSEDGSLVDDQVARLLAGRRIATAESCTAGLLAARLTDLAGSSAYVAGGVVAYANEAKVDLLGVDAALIDEHGAVSQEVAEAMAAGALRRFNADTAVAITGIAGPGGGTADKPVGTVWFCVMLADGTTVIRSLRCRVGAQTSGSGQRRWRCTCCGAHFSRARRRRGQRPDLDSPRAPQEGLRHRRAAQVAFGDGRTLPGGAARGPRAGELRLTRTGSDDR